MQIEMVVHAMIVAAEQILVLKSAINVVGKRITVIVDRTTTILIEKSQ